MTDMVWHFLRMSRSTPPGLAKEAERADLYRAAMQQFEDLMVAAAASGPAGRPLPLYYALSQAGRAVLAAREPDMTRVICPNERHGLTIPHRNVNDDLFAVPVEARSSNTGLFQRVASATGSALIVETAMLGALVASLPDAGDEGWNEDRWPTAVPLYPVMGLAEEVDMDRDSRANDFSRFRHGTMHVAIQADDVATQDDLEDLARRYPTIAKIRPRLFVLTTGRRGRYEVRTPSGAAVMIEVSVSPNSTDPVGDHVTMLDAIAPLYRWKDRRWLRPSVEGDAPPPSPLMTWWAILFALSTFARYHPVPWTSSLVVDQSSSAAVLERILDLAQDAVPHLVFEALGLSGDGPLLLRPGADTPPVSR